MPEGREGTMVASTLIDTVQHAHTLTELMAAGDAACAAQRSDALVEAARGLARCVAAPMQMELDRVASTAPRDLGAACRHWEQVRAELRRQLRSDAR
jgi:hypothetical protein